MGEGDEEVGGDDLVDVVVNEGPDGEGRAVDVGSCAEAGEHYDAGEEGVEFVAVAGPRAEDDAVDFIAGEDQLEEEAEGMVGEDPADDVEVDQAGEAFCWPAGFSFESGEGEGAGVE